MTPPKVCKTCGCSAYDACPGSCSWDQKKKGVCSRCGSDPFTSAMLAEALGIPVTSLGVYVPEIRAKGKLKGFRQEVRNGRTMNIFNGLAARTIAKYITEPAEKKEK